MKLVANKRLLVGATALLIGAGLLVDWSLGLPPFFAASDRGASAERHGRRHAFDEDQGPVPITIAEAKREDVPVTIDEQAGTVQALNTVTIRTQVDGRLISLPIKEGDEIKKGDVVALIEPNLYQAAYDQAVAKKAQDEATLANARIDLVRYEKLAKSNYGSQQQFTTQKALVDQYEAQTRADQGAIDSAKTTLGYTTIHSPIDGRAGIRSVDVGNILHASDQTGILVITQLKPIYVIFTIPQKYLLALQRAHSASPAKVSVTKPVDNGLGVFKDLVISDGVVSVIDNQIDPATGTVKIRATFPNNDLALWPGDFVRARVQFETLKGVVTVPKVAVQPGPSGANFVWVLVDDGKVKQTPVSTGLQDENIAVVTQGLDAGAKVVTTGFPRLTDGAAVQVIQAQGDATSKDTPPPSPPPPSAGGKRHKRGDAGEGGQAPTR